jgi:tetratricopeptide (TPR) repeat protein
VQAAVVAIVLACGVAVAAASPAQDLDAGFKSFRGKDYESAVRFVTPLLYPDEQLAQPADLVLAHVVLGAAYYEKGQRDRARAEFEKALQLEPEKTLDTMLFSTGAVHLFDETKDDIVARRLRDEELIKLQKEREALRLKIAGVYETHEYWVNFIPFGAGQFQDHRIGAGALFASSEAAAVIAYASIFGYLTNRYPIVCPPTGVTGPCTRPVPLNEVHSAQLLQGFDWGTAAMFGILYGIGVADSLLHYKPRVQINVPPDLLKDLTAPKKTPKKTSLLDRMHVIPMATPTSVGIGLGWEN